MPNRLDITAKHDVSYCIPGWLRDEQIRQAITRVPGRLAQGPRREEPCAVVGFGPSLQDTWEKVRGFPFIITCSGSHRFLIDRGLVPTWHVEVDPREHKVALLGPPHPDVEYLIASTCHPRYFDHLEGFRVKLWHVFDATAEGLRLLPSGETAVTGGCDVGLRALTLAAFLGFRDLHVFGLDGCARGSARHAAAHPHTPKQYAECEYRGVVYHTTSAMLNAAQQVWHELDQLPAVRATFYGDGLIQAMAQDYVRKDPTAHPLLANTVAFDKPALISAGYRDLNARLHHDNLAYGVGGSRHAPVVLDLLRKCEGLRSVLDYGCGKGYLAKALAAHNLPIWEYDPAIPGKDESPRPADLVVCTDVLEHVEPAHLRAVLMDLRRCVRQVGYFTIHTGPAQKTLPDGRNTHLIQRGLDWWRRKLGAYFTVGKIIPRGPELLVVVGPKAAKEVT